MANTIKYQEEWAVSLQERLKAPLNWKEVADVIYSDTAVFELPYVATSSESAIQTGITRGNTYTFQDVTMSTEVLSVTGFDVISEILDRADEAQSNYSKKMERARLQGDKVNERVEALMLADHAAWTNIGSDGAGGVGLGTTGLDISSSNIDDLIGFVIQTVQDANGYANYQRSGGFAVWRPKDWNSLRAFMQANGHAFADKALQDPTTVIGKESLGLTHYVSTKHTSNHVFAGVRKIQKIGLLNSTFGKVYTTDDPPGASGGPISAIGVISRLDYGVKTPTVGAALVFDVNANA